MLAYTTSLNESELRAMWMDVYDRVFAPQVHCAQAAILKGRDARAVSAELPPRLGLGRAHAEEDLRRHVPPQLGLAREL